jgi:hypothetical protein
VKTGTYPAKKNKPLKDFLSGQVELMNHVENKFVTVLVID